MIRQTLVTELSCEVDNDPLPHSAQLRQECNLVESIDELEKLTQKIL